MKKRILTCMLSAAFFLHSYCQEYLSPENYSLFRAVVNQDTNSSGRAYYFCTRGAAFTNETVYLINFLDREYFSRYLAEKGIPLSFDTLFTEEDLKDMQAVCRKYEKAVPAWDKRMLAKKEIPVYDDLRKKFRPSMTALYYHAGIPLYTRDRQHALVYVESVCNGSCDHGSVFIFSRKSGNWKRMAEIVIWTS
ncbi:MAG: hypothetical protein U0U70_01150 [Chitinophagaceae bacterium]